jgi:hypothetical protein
MYKYKNNYGDCQILDLNMIDVHSMKRTRLSLAETFVVCIPFIALMATVMVFMIPDLSFLAQCSNIAGGDICSITLE